MIADLSTVSCQVHRICGSVFHLVHDDCRDDMMIGLDDIHDDDDCSWLRILMMM